MASERNTTLWIPLAFGLSAVILGLALAKFWASLPDWASDAGVLIALAFIVLAVYLGYQGQSDDRRGGRRGRAVASGEDAQAQGGHGGNAGAGDGGGGGAALAKGKSSIAKGGDGGHG